MSDGGLWILGAAGRTGRAVAARLVAAEYSPMLIGRDAGKLNCIAERLGGGTTVCIARSLPEIAEMIAKGQPKIVLNTIGPFTRTALTVASSCPPGTHYVDLSNELPSVQAILELDERAASASSTFVTGAGYGVLATESLVLKLRGDRPPADRVRCAAIPAVVAEPGLLGEAFAASITGGLAYGGRLYEAGKLIKAPAMGDYEKLVLPDGKHVGTASVPSGELEAAMRASGAGYAVSATSMVPSTPILRAILPGLLTMMKIGFIRRFAEQRIAAIEVKPAKTIITPVSWSHARVAWSSGEIRQGWMRTGDAMVFTADVMAHVALCLARGECPPGAFTPGACFGPELAVECGGEFIIEISEP